MAYDVIIVGAGPGGLACAEAAARHGLTVLVLERKQCLGRKICAGGITWNGLLKKVPEDISEKRFARQHILTRLQKVCVTSPTPIIATVNREKLGQYMANKAQRAGAEIRLGCQVTAIDDRSILVLDRASGLRERLTFSYLVGADGSSSLVRRFLGLPIADIGIGINYQLPGNYPEMQWHLNSALFASGYAWIFPHRDTASIGAYVDAKRMRANSLKANLLRWGEQNGLPLRQHKASADWINFDFRGWRFGDRTFLVGDAAGLASGLTGEGIYPAIISGETVGHFLADPQIDTAALQNLIKNHARHRKMVGIAGCNHLLTTVISEIITYCLKTKIIDFSAIEMAS